MPSFAWLVVVLLVLGCGGTPPPVTSDSVDEPGDVVAASEAPESSSTTAEAARDEPAPSDAPAAEQPPAYQEPPPIVVRRYHVFASMEARVKKKVTITSLLTTAADDADALAPGLEALLEHKPAGAEEWAPVADVTVTSVTTKGSRAAGNERQVIEVEIRSEHAAASQKGKLSPFTRRGRVRLQVDRPTSQPSP